MTLCTSLFLYSKAMRVLDAKAAVEKKWQKLEKLPAWQATKVKSKKEVIVKAQKERRTVHSATPMDLCHLKNSELEQQFQNYEGRAVLRREQDSSASKNDGSQSSGSFLPDHLDAQDKRVTQYQLTPKSK